MWGNIRDERIREGEVGSRYMARTKARALLQQDEHYSEHQGECLGRHKCELQVSFTTRDFGKGLKAHLQRGWALEVAFRCGMLMRSALLNVTFCGFLPLL